MMSPATRAAGLALFLAVGLAAASEPPDREWDFSMDVQATPNTSWSADERAALERGEAISRHWRDAEGRARGLSAVLVNASTVNVWKVIVDIDAYVEFMPYVTASYVTRWTEAEIYTQIEAGYHLTTLGVTTRYRLDHRWYADKGVIVFDVLPEGSSPIAAGDGFWRVSAWNGSPGPGGRPRVILEYSVDMAMQWWVPSVLERKAASRLPTVVRLIKRRAEGVEASSATPARAP